MLLPARVPNLLIWLRALSLVVSLPITLLASSAAAAPEAHLLRVDPRTAVQDGNPVLTTVIDLTATERIGQVTSACAALRGDAELDCVSDALEKPGSLARAIPFPEKDVLFTVRVGGSDSQAELLSYSRFGSSQDEPGVGTAWLLIVDADDRMGKGFDEAQGVAEQFIESMGPHDLVNLILLSDRQILQDTGWLPLAKADDAKKTLYAQEKTIRSQGRTRPLLDLLKRAASDSFRSLNNPGKGLSAPLNQAMVVISSGYGGGDPATTGPGASQLSSYFTAGRLDDENTALPKLPIPVVSIFLPPKAMEEQQLVARTFMENLANPSIGGFFTVLRDGHEGHGQRIVDTVRARFADLIIARFKLSCLAPSTTQSFSLLFKNKDNPIAGDSTFQDVPVGFDPSDWPLDLDVELTRKKAQEVGGIYPGGKLRVFGRFCWENDLSRPEVYFIPPGESLPQDLSESPDAAAKVQKRLIALDMRGKALQANQSFAEFQVPDVEQILHGDGERKVVRLVVVDSKAHRTSGVTETSVLTLNGGVPPVPVWPIVGAAAGGVFLLILGGYLLRRGSKKDLTATRRSHSPIQESPYATPAPVSRGPSRPQISRAILEGPAGRFIVLPNGDLRVGRDGTRCAAVIPELQVSGLHATFRVENGDLLLRDEGSTSGTRIDGLLLEPGVWKAVGDGMEVSLGPEVLKVTLVPV